MRTDESTRPFVANGISNGTNGTTPKKPTNVSINGHSPNGVNGSTLSVVNGADKRLSPVREPTYRGHDREEISRILIQGLIDMGYAETAATLSRESGFELENPAVTTFRSAVLDGNWAAAESILLGSEIDGEGDSVPKDHYADGLILAEDADRGQMLFAMREQKFIELLQERDLGTALMVLRHELTPLNHDIQQLHHLSSLLMCPREELRTQAPHESRQELLSELTQSIAPSVMIRDHRLSELLDQVKRGQINECLYHNTSASPSLYADHHCERENFPSRTWMELDQHSEEVWYLQFSHDGTKLATASQDKSVIIFETGSFKVLQRLTRHDGPVTYVTWSPDDSKLISCCMDKKARVWDVETGQVIMTVDHQTIEPAHMTAASWAPDGSTFVTSSLDIKTPLCHWRMQPDEQGQLLHKWEPGFRLSDCVISPDGQRLLLADTEQCFYVIDFHTYEEEYRVPFSSKLTCITISQDSKTVLVNLAGKDGAPGEVQLLDIVTGDTLRRFEGQKQAQYVIRGAFGGAAENFVLSGSEDSRIYVWHKENGMLIETLRGHGLGKDPKTCCVNAVSWNPKDAGMFASAGDDGIVRIWTNSVSPNHAVASATEKSVNRESHARSSAQRILYRGERSNL